MQRTVPDPNDSSPATLILGLGNSLLGDEAAGIAVIDRLQTDGDLARVQLVDGGTLSFSLAGLIADHPRLIVVDAAAMDSPPGTLKVFENEAMDRQLGGKGKSVHEVSLMDLMDMARLTDSLPYPRALVGIEPEKIDLGTELTLAVAAAVPRAAAAIRSLLTAWDQDTGS